MAGHAHEIVLAGGDTLTDQSREIARVWITNNAGSSVWIDAGVIEDPQMFGVLMADTIRHAARAYAATWDIGEDTAMQVIVDGLAEELREQFNDVRTIAPGSLN